jgi:hypothetical protein
MCRTICANIHRLNRSRVASTLAAAVNAVEHKQIFADKKDAENNDHDDHKEQDGKQPRSAM